MNSLSLDRSYIKLTLAIALSSNLSAQNMMIDLAPGTNAGTTRAASIGRAQKGQLSDHKLTLSTSFASAYDSNVTWGSSSSGRAKEDDLVISPGVDVSYSTGGTSWLGGAQLSSSYDEYLDHEDYSGLNYDLNAFAAYRGGKIVASFYSGVSGDRGRDLYSTRNVPIEKTSFINGAIVRYNLSPKTSILGTLSYRSTLANTAGYNDSQALTSTIAALWSATPLIDLGPGMRYALRTGENQRDVISYGPNFNLNYQLSEKVSLRSNLGVDFQAKPSGGDASLNGALGLNYKASELWSTSLSLVRDTNSNPNIAGALDEITSLRLGYQRKVRRITLDIGTSAILRSTDRIQGTGNVSQQDFTHMAVDCALTYPLYGDSADIRLATRFQDFSSDDSSRDWSGWQSGLGFTWRF